MVFLLKVKEFFIKIYEQYLKKYWKYIIGFVIGLFALLHVIFKKKPQKEKITDTSSDCVGRVIEVEEKSNQGFVDGVKEIEKTSSNERKEVETKFEDKNKKLEDKKKEIIEQEVKSDTVGKDLANLVGANYVDSNAKNNN